MIQRQCRVITVSIIYPQDTVGQLSQLRISYDEKEKLWAVNPCDIDNIEETIAAEVKAFLRP